MLKVGDTIRLRPSKYLDLALHNRLGKIIEIRAWSRWSYLIEVDGEPLYGHTIFPMSESEMELV